MPKSIRQSLLLLMLGLLPGVAALAQDDEILKPQDAYRYAIADTGDAIEIDWVVEDGYYLYRNKMSYQSGHDAIVLGAAEMPEGEMHEDEFFGVQQIYRGRFFVRIPYTVVGELPQSAEIAIKSQGCADIGLCYPPQTWTESVRMIARNDDGSGKIDLGTTFGAFSGANDEFLPVDEVFEPIVTALDGNTVEVAIRALDGYYLYKEKISAKVVNSTVAQAGRLELPQGKMKTDQYFGEQEVFYGDVFGELAIARATPEAMTLDLEIGYQGCAEDGICYPPVTKLLSVDLPEATAVTALSAAAPASAAGGAPVVSEQARLAQLITGSGMMLVIATFFGAGLLLAFTPWRSPHGADTVRHHRR